MGNPNLAPNAPGTAQRDAGKWSPRWLVGVVSLLLAAHVSLAFLGVLNRSVTSDETGHLTAGYAYWKFGDYRLQPENGNLPQRWGSLPLLLAKPGLDPSLNRDDWAASRVWNVAQSFLFETGNNTDFLLLCARSTMLCWSVAGGLLVFWWARLQWGDAGGVGALALFAFSPTTLAHGPLVTSDMCAAVCLLAALAAWWRMCLQPSLPRILVAGLVTGLAFVAKFSAVLLLPVFAGLGVIAFAFRRSGGTHAPCAQASRVADSGTDETEACSPLANIPPFKPTRKPWLLLALRLGGAFVGAALIAGSVVWCFFGFRYSAADPTVAAFGHFYLPWETALADGGRWTAMMQLARHYTILPEAFLYGFSFVIYFSAQRGAFLAGNYSSTGWWWFFPFAFLIKSTIGELLITGLVTAQGLAITRKIKAVDWRKISCSPLVPLALFSVVFAAVTLTSKLNIGQRHILPLYLILFIFAGWIFSSRTPKLFRVLGGIALLFSVLETLSNQPNHLAFFNRLVGGPKNGWQLLVDSSLDWGQDVSTLATWVQKNRRPNERVYVSCFGTADPQYEGIRGESLAPYYSLGKPRVWFDLEPGLYCLSATMLQDVYGIRPGPWTDTLERDFQNLKIAARFNLADGTWDRKIPETGFHPEHPLWLLDRLRFARLCQYLKVRKPDAVINYTQFVFRLSPEEIETVMNKPFSALTSLMEKAAERKR